MQPETPRQITNQLDQVDTLKRVTESLRSAHEYERIWENAEGGGRERAVAG